jgi:hypothetical protein
MTGELAVRLKAVKLYILVGLSVCALGMTSMVHAQEQKEAKTESKGGGEKDKKKTKIDFEDELVEGELKKPELFYLLQKKQFNFKRLIKLRENFMPEMRRDGEELGRGRGK